MNSNQPNVIATWLNGWGMSQEALLRPLETWQPSWTHHVIQPVKGWQDRVAASLAQSSVLGGYSTGAFLLLQSQNLRTRVKRGILLAPFFDFRARAHGGGLSEEVQLRYLMRWLVLNPRLALRDFWRRAGLPDDPAAFTMSHDDLCWGIKRLLQDSAPRGAAHAWEGYIGTADALLNAEEMQQLWPELHVVMGGTHDVQTLLSSVPDDSTDEDSHAMSPIA